MEYVAETEIDQLISRLTVDEKAQLICGSGSMNTKGVERLGVPEMTMVDGPCGIRGERENNFTTFPCITSVASSWDREISRKMGQALGRECKTYGIDMLLAPGINMKRHILCGRNFEYFSEDPVLAGEMAAGYVNGLQETGTAACLKHFAVNNQEKYRAEISAELDERTLREIYLKAFDIVVKKSRPLAVMCAYNKVNAIWCSENEHLLTEILREEWGYQGAVVSDWGAVQDTCRALVAGMDLQMPGNPDILEEIRKGLEKGYLSQKHLDDAVKRVLRLVYLAKSGSTDTVTFDRERQHEDALEIEAAGITLLKNENQILPLTQEKYKRIAVIGSYAVSPIRCGQGSAEVYSLPQSVDQPLEELKKCMPRTEFTYVEGFDSRSYSDEMLWPKLGEIKEAAEQADAVLVFAGTMVSEDTEMFDRRTARLNPNFGMFIEEACRRNPNVVVVLQSGSALILDDWHQKTPAILEMWLGGEACGKAVAQILCGERNPSGKLAETFPCVERKNLNYPGNGRYIGYDEKLEIGYRYYDRHPEQIGYPFGHGLSYTMFDYKDLCVSVDEDRIVIFFQIRNTGSFPGAEVVQIYMENPGSTVSRPLKELKTFEKIFLQSGESKNVELQIPLEEIGYYNVMLKKWVTESGMYEIYVGSSSQDIRLKKCIYVKDVREVYTQSLVSQGQMIGDAHE